MGVVTSDLSYNLKSQSEVFGEKHTLYKLLSMTGDGELVKLTRQSIKNKNLKILDDFIMKNVNKYLYKDGNGKKVNIFLLNHISKH
jgi:hypothetical protein